MALSFGNILGGLGLGLSAHNTFRESPGERMFREDLARRRGYMQNSINPPAADIAREEESDRRDASMGASELLKVLRRAGRAGRGAGPVERQDDIISTIMKRVGSGDTARNRVSNKYARLAGIPAQNDTSSRSRQNAMAKFFANAGGMGNELFQSPLWSSEDRQPYLPQDEGYKGGLDYDPYGWY